MLLSKGLKYLWKLVNLLQFTVFMSEWQLSYPNNSIAFLKYLKNLALMEFLPKDEIINFLSGYACEDCEEESEERRRVLQENDDENLHHIEQQK